MRWLLVTAFACLSLGVSAQQMPGRIVDLGHPLGSDNPSWSGKAVFGWTAIVTHETGNALIGKFFSDEHFGTHLDAPIHSAKGGLTVDQIPVDMLMRPGFCIHVEEKVRRDEDYQLTRADVEAFERRIGPIPAGAMVLLATGWDTRWPDRTRYMNERGGTMHFPGFSVDAARYLAVTRRVAAIAIDTASVDYGPSKAFEVHHTTQPHGVYHVENAAHLTTLPDKGFVVIAAPIDLEGGSGGPTRLFALLGS